MRFSKLISREVPIWWWWICPLERWGAAENLTQIMVRGGKKGPSPSREYFFFACEGPTHCNSPQKKSFPFSSSLYSLPNRQPLTDHPNSRRRQNGCYVCASSLKTWTIWADAPVSRVLSRLRINRGPLAGKPRSSTLFRVSLACQLDLSRVSPSIAQVWNMACVLRDVAWGVGDEDANSSLLKSLSLGACGLLKHALQSHPLTTSFGHLVWSVVG